MNIDIFRHITPTYRYKLDISYDHLLIVDINMIISTTHLHFSLKQPYIHTCMHTYIHTKHVVSPFFPDLAGCAGGCQSQRLGGSTVLSAAWTKPFDEPRSGRSGSSMIYGFFNVIYKLYIYIHINIHIFVMHIWYM